MFWQKIESYSKLLFLLLLLFTQALVFVAVGARDKQEYLSLAFVEPMSGYLPAEQEPLFLEAYLEGPKGERDFSLVYFSVVNENLNYEMNFEASYSQAGTWRSLASWEISGIPSGQYFIWANAQVYQDDKRQIYKSRPQSFFAGGDYQAALELDIDENKSQSDEVLPPISEESELGEVVAEEEIVLSGLINSPSPSQNISGDLFLQISLNRELNPAKGEALIAADIKNQDSDLSFRFQLTSNAQGLVHSRSFDTSLIQDGQRLYPNGAYNCEFFVLGADNQELFSLGAVNFSISNETIEEVEEASADLMLLSPLPGEPITDRDFLLSLNTALSGSQVRAQFYKQNDPAISTGDILISYFDGYHWTQAIHLDNSFVNGDYILNISLLGENNAVLYSESFDFLLTLGSNEFLFDPDTIEFKIINLETNISGTVFPVVLSSFDFSSADIYLEIISSINQEEKINLPMARAIWETLLAWGFKQSDFSNTPHAYLATLDSSRLANGNYRLIIKNNLNPNFSATEKLISVFNTIDSQSQAEDQQQIEEREVELTDRPVAIDTSAPDSLQMSGKVLIYQHETCLDLGIKDENTCRRFMSMAQSLDQRCLSQSIFDGMACEDYLRRLKVDLECQAAGIFEPERCKDYLLEKYAGAVDCRLADSLLCTDVLRNKHLNRLVMAKKNQAEIENIIDSLFGRTVSTEELGQKIESVGLNKELLSLAPRQETKVFLAKAASQTILYNEDILTVVSGGLMMLDSDGDGLPDDLELYYGTDPFNPDTDGDGYLDGLEVMNNYNPLGEGLLLQERLFFDELLFDQIPLEHPQLRSSRISDDLALANLENLQDSIRLSGQAEAGTWILVYLYSDLPMVLLAKADVSGNWSYNLEKPLNDGYHKAYVTVNDNTGKIVRQSRPVSFFVQGAMALSASEYFGESPASARASEDEASFLASYSYIFSSYIFWASLLALVIIILGIFLYKKRRA
ncbi:MAG: Ig-like domain-containing protein [Patescibacteria group bacterium]|nr:Ig-like domain-containing protein [Patescibacteria group bacterium]